jgi:hypothetical protein
MAAAPPTRRRWFQFSLGTMFLLMTTLALLLLAVNEHRERQQLSERIGLLDRKVESLDTEMRRQQSVAQRRQLLDTIDVPVIPKLPQSMNQLHESMERREK